eukprot:CAMPEP_0201149640 /NCGR_PEP_ID=MMETSP0851-20130426/10902_1 /ASSEMBLY_ACC=CAM_ASM_000631 /TAXON_ID=183588 /ORGANISM="Pseudo-nitzschia fraudulenta, Strain WWA7" /LENGTH=554 /DNA_ID=CAMNT_0047426077 /DNA_START=326 /DNA_END=1987 /DNA_ORIENTATION=+
MGSYTCPVVSSADENVIANASGKADAELERQLQNTREVEKQLLKKIHLLTSEKEQAKASAPITEAARIGFPKTVNKVIVDYATVPRDDINKILEIGVPMDPTKTGSEEVVVLYTDTKSMPSGKHDSMVGLDASTALENCNTVKVILQQPATKHQQCFAIVPQWESYHVHKFMRVPMPGSRVDSKSPLKYVSRTQADDGKVAKVPSWQRDTKPSFDGLVDYLSHLDASLENLQPILQDAMHNARNAEGVSEVMKKSKIMVVLVCNKGQSHLFQNFVCNARAKGLDLSRIIMFATDQYTVDLCKSLDIEVFYDEHLFGSMPESAAKRYGDGIFSQMMMAKVYCVHLVLRLGYDVLFQDVDVVWQRNPLEYLETKEKKEWDMLFQDDGSRQTRYQPYSPNTGFYFVRNNNLTQYFFNCLLRKGDLISRGKSHQAALASQIAEFVSWQGLRVKVWPKFGNTLFPGGVEYHNGKDYMKQFIDGRIKPFIFHMSWTLNKDNKKIFFEQMAEWYTKDDKSGCAGLDCCVAEPIITCHYKDKPSKIPCKDSPSIDKKGRSFW